MSLLIAQIFILGIGLGMGIFCIIEDMKRTAILWLFTCALDGWCLGARLVKLGLLE